MYPILNYLTYYFYPTTNILHLIFLLIYFLFFFTSVPPKGIRTRLRKDLEEKGARWIRNQNTHGGGQVQMEIQIHKGKGKSTKVLWLKELGEKLVCEPPMMNKILKRL
jgi:hypothetical protein